MIRLALLLPLVLLGACRAEPDPFTPDWGYDYFPLEMGKEWWYEVDSVIYDPNGAALIDSSSWQWREVVTDTFTDSAGRLWYSLEQFRRPDSTFSWELAQVSALSHADNLALRQENGLTFVKLVFPIDSESQWDGNQYFDPFTTVIIAGETIEMFKDWSYQVISLDAAELAISEANSENLIERRFSEARYTRGIGLTYRHLEILDTQNLDNSKPWEIRAEKGFILCQTLIYHN